MGREGVRGNRQRGFSVGAHGRWARVIAIDSGLHLQGAQDRVWRRRIGWWRRIVFGSQPLGGEGEGHSRRAGSAASGRQQRGRGSCVRERRMYAGWAATRRGTPEHAYPCDETGMRRTRSRGRVVQRHRAEDRGGRWGEGRGEAA